MRRWSKNCLGMLTTTEPSEPAEVPRKYTGSGVGLNEADRNLPDPTLPAVLPRAVLAFRSLSTRWGHEHTTPVTFPVSVNVRKTARADTPQTPSVQTGVCLPKASKDLGAGTAARLPGGRRGSEEERANAPRTNSSPQNTSVSYVYLKDSFSVWPKPLRPPSGTGSEDGVPGKGQPPLAR